MSKTIVKASSEQSLLIAIPHLAGRAIADSVLLIPFHGSRTGMALRCDLPHDVKTRQLPQWADEVMTSVAGPAPDAVAIIVISEQRVGGGSLPEKRIDRALVAAARRLSIPVRARLVQAVDVWGRYQQPDEAMGPIAELISMGHDGSLPFLSPIPAPRVPAIDPEAATEAVEAIMRRTSHPTAMETVDAVQRLLLTERTIDDVALVIAALQDPSRRDGVTVQLLDGREGGVNAHLAQTGKVDGSASAERLLGVGDAPEHARVEESIALMEYIAKRVAGEARAPVLTVLGQLHWLIGRSGTASACIESALHEDPELGMALLMATVLQSGMLPEWVEQQRMEDAR